MNNYEAIEREAGFIRARFTLFAEGGRRSRIFDDYRCDWDIGNVENNDTPTINGGPITLEHKEELHPGEEAIVRIHPLAPQFWGTSLRDDHLRPRGSARGGVCGGA